MRAALLLALILLLPLFAVPVGVGALAPAPASNILVGFHGSVPPDAGSIIARNGGVLVRQLAPLPIVAVRAADAGFFLSYVRAEPTVAFAQSDIQGKFLSNPDGAAIDDPAYPSQASYLARMGVPAFWADHTFGAPDVVVAVIDAGVDPDHVDLAPNLWRNPDGGYGFDLYNDNLPGVPNDPLDHAPFDTSPDRHGTKTAGIVGAVTDNGLNVAGVAGRSKVMALRIGAQHPHANYATEAVLAAVTNGADVIVMPVGWPADEEPLGLSQAIDFAESRGVLVVASAGNGGSVGWPALHPRVLSVGGVGFDALGQTMALPNTEVAWGARVDLSGVARSVWSLCAGNLSCAVSSPTKGATSWTSPQVAGAAALLRACYPDASPATLRGALKATAENVVTYMGDTGWDNKTGAGLVNVTAALGWLGSGCPGVT